MTFERDEVELTGGVRHGRTLGGPLAIRVANTEWPKWETVMSADPVAPGELEGQARNAPLTRPRPGHADLAGMQKYGFDDARPVLERGGARETGGRRGGAADPQPGARHPDPVSRGRAGPGAGSGRGDAGAGRRRRRRR